MGSLSSSIRNSTVYHFALHIEEDNGNLGGEPGYKTKEASHGLALDLMCTTATLLRCICLLSVNMTMSLPSLGALVACLDN